MLQRVEEGNSYLFEVKRVIGINSDSFYVLAGPDKRRYLLPLKGYNSYGITVGKGLKCRVDKINCKGEVFLEPEHPHYREGEWYEFTFMERGQRIDRSGREIEVAFFRGETDEPFPVPVEDLPSKPTMPGEKVRLKVKRIIKGVIDVAGEPCDKGGRDGSDDGVFSFEIAGISRGVDGKEYYIVRDGRGESYTMPLAYYKHYGLSTGSSFRGRFLRYKENERITIEPLNPWFEPGKVYSFTVKEFISRGEGLNDVMVLADSFGYLHQVDPVRDRRPGDKVEYRVERMRKGWPLLRRM